MSRRLTFCFLYSGRCRIAGTVGCCCVLLRQSDIWIGGWDWRSWTLVSNCAFGVFFTGQQGLDIVVTLGHKLGKYLAGFVSGVGCHAVSSVDKLLLKQKKLYVLRDIQYEPLLFFLIVLYLMLKTISLEQLTTERQGYQFLTVHTCITFHFLH